MIHDTVSWAETRATASFFANLSLASCLCHTAQLQRKHNLELKANSVALTLLHLICSHQVSATCILANTIIQFIMNHRACDLWPLEQVCVHYCQNIIDCHSANLALQELLQPGHPAYGCVGVFIHM